MPASRPPATMHGAMRRDELLTAAADDTQDPPDPPGGPALRVRTVWISDLHLGTPGCQAAALLDFLKAHPSDYLYLVGDIVDGWQRGQFQMNFPKRFTFWVRLLSHLSDGLYFAAVRRVTGL